MTAKISQTSVLVLSEEIARPRLSNGSVLVLWGVGASGRVSQLNIQVLSRAPVRRTIGITH